MPSLPLDGQAPQWLDIPHALEQIGDEAVLQEMLGMLQTTLGSDVPQIAQLLQAHNVRDANRMLHALKGFIPIFCTAPLCQQVEQVEMLSKSGMVAEVQQAYALLAPQLQQLQADIVRHLETSVRL